MSRIASAIAAIALLCVVGGLIRTGWYRQAHVLLPPRLDSQPPALPATLESPAILVFSKTNGFRHHAAIPAALTTLQRLADRNGWSLVATDNGAVFYGPVLERFDVVIWNNVSGRVLTDEQRDDLRRFIEDSGGFIGLHAAGDGSHDAWSWYVNEVIRAQFTMHPVRPQVQRAMIRMEDREHPATAHFAAQWEHTDEWYSFATSPRQHGAHVLGTVDESTYNPQRWPMGEDHPVIWSHEQVGGRVFYSALGHTAETYRDPAYRQLLEGAIRWAGRLTDR